MFSNSAFCALCMLSVSLLIVHVLSLSHTSSETIGYIITHLLVPIQCGYKFQVTRFYFYQVWRQAIMGYCIIILILCIVSVVLFTCCDSLQLSSTAHNDLGNLLQAYRFLPISFISLSSTLLFCVVYKVHDSLQIVSRYTCSFWSWLPAYLSGSTTKEA